MRKLVKVPRSELKAALDAEKAAKASKKRVGKGLRRRDIKAQ
jgi:hypothetical protein